MIKCLLTELGRAGRRTDRAQRGPCAMTEGQIFSRPARPNSVNKYTKIELRK